MTDVLICVSSVVCGVCIIILVMTLDQTDREDSCQPLLGPHCPNCGTERSSAYMRQETIIN